MDRLDWSLSATRTGSVQVEVPPGRYSCLRTGTCGREILSFFNAQSSMKKMSTPTS
jgi:hypothetical protein